MGATLDKFMTIEEVPEEWRSLDVTVGGPVDASNFCDNGVRTYKYNLLNFFPKSMFEQMRRTANQYFLLICIMMFLGTYTTWFYSPLTPWSTFLPLMIILLVTMAKGQPGRAKTAANIPGADQKGGQIVASTFAALARAASEPCAGVVRTENRACGRPEAPVQARS